jgi:hypothetical protein
MKLNASSSPFTRTSRIPWDTIQSACLLVHREKLEGRRGKRSEKRKVGSRKRKGTGDATEPGIGMGNRNRINGRRVRGACIEGEGGEGE